MALRIIQIGVGGFGRRWVDVLSKAKGVEVVALADINAEALAAAQEKLSLPASFCFKDFRKAIDSVEADALINVTPPKFHKPVALYAFKRGLDVLTEKPLADTMRNAKDMVEVARKTRRKLMVSQNYRFQRWARTVRRIIDKKSLGELGHLSIKFFRTLRRRPGFRRRMEHLLLADMSIHHFDLMRYILGAEPVRIYARTWNPKWSWSQGDVAAVVIFDMKNGVTVVYDANWVATERQTTWNGEWVFQFARGRVALRDDVVYTARIGKEEKPVRMAAMPCQNQEYSFLEFRRAISENRQPETSGKDNLASLAMVFAAIESSKKGRAVELRKFLTGGVRVKIRQEDWPKFRHTNYIAFAGEKSKKISMRLECIQRGRSADWLVYRLIDPNNERIALGEIPPGESAATSFTPKQSGLYVYEIGSGLNLTTIKTERAPWAIVALERPRLHTVEAIERLYFYVPKGLKRFNIFFNTTATGEGLAIKIFSPADVLVDEEEVGYDSTKSIEIRVPQGADGKAWGLSILKPKAPGLTLDDVQLYLGRELAPYLTKKPEWALSFGRRKHP